MNARAMHCLAWVCLLVPIAVAAQAQAPDERARIVAERAAVEATWAKRQRECASRFVVTSCVEDAQRERRKSLAAIRRQELVLDEAQRRERAAARLERLDAKVRERPLPAPRLRETQEPKLPPAPREPREPREPRIPRAAKQSPDSAEPAASAEPSASGLDLSAAPGPRPATAGARPAAVRAQRQQEDEARAAAFAARAEQARARREAAERRNAERAAAGKTSRPLPVPAGASAP